MLCKNLKLKLIAIFSILLSCFNLMADDIVFTANAPQTVEVGEQFRVNFIINAKDCESFEVNILDFQILSGPNVSANSTIQWVNGQMLQKPTKTFTFVLTAENEGKCSIPSATIKCSGKTYQSEPLDIKVVASSNSATSNNNQQQDVSVAQMSNRDNSANYDETYEKAKKILENSEKRVQSNTLRHINNSDIENNSILTPPSYNDSFEKRYDPFNKSKYDDKISWSFNPNGSNDVGDLRAEAQGGWGRFKNAIIGDEIYRGKEYESKSPGEKVFTGIFWADVLQKSRPILLILIVVAIVIFVRRRR